MGLFQGAEQLRLLGIQGDGLFAEHVAAHFHQFLGDGIVQVMGQADVNHIGLDLPHHLLVVGVERHTGGNLRRQGLVDIADRRQLHAGIAGNGVNMDNGDGAKADDRSFHHVAVLLIGQSPRRRRPPWAKGQSICLVTNGEFAFGGDELVQLGIVRGLIAGQGNGLAGPGRQLRSVGQPDAHDAVLTGSQQGRAGEHMQGEVLHNGAVLHAPAVGVLEGLGLVQAAAAVAASQHDQLHHGDILIQVVLIHHVAELRERERTVLCRVGVVAFGIGTYLSNDTCVPALNIVMKTTMCNGMDVAKISDTAGKGMCKNSEYIEYLQRCIDWRMNND